MIKIITLLALMLILYPVHNTPIIERCLHGVYSRSVVAYGDSLTEGWHATTDCGYTWELEDMIHARVYQVAKGGYTTQQMLPRLPEVLAYNPTLIIVELGTNDMYEDRNISDFIKDYQTIIKGIDSIPHICLTVWPNPGHDSPNILNKYNDVIYQSCNGTVVNLTPIYQNKAYVDSPTQHPNNAGHRAIAHLIDDILKIKRIGNERTD